MPLIVIQYHRVYFSLLPFLMSFSNCKKSGFHYLQYMYLLFNSSIHTNVVSGLLTHIPVRKTFTN